MIRAAAIALGLSGFGAGAATVQAHGVVPIQPLIAAVDAPEIGAERATVVAPMVEHSGDPVETIADDTRAAIATPPVTTRAAKFCVSDTPVAATFVAASSYIGVLPFDVPVIAQEVMDGSDPSADFCP